MKPAIEQSLANNDERKVRRRGRCGVATKSRTLFAGPCRGAGAIKIEEAASHLPS
jgi:hypothetical protein